MAKKSSGMEGWIRKLLRAEPPRSKSLIVTILGDSIAPRARGLWLSQLIQLLRPFDVDERLARTSTFRLAEEGWLEPQRDGRRSRYVLTDFGMRRLETAYHRVYDPPARRWNGHWTMAVLSRAGSRAARLVADRAELRHELEWEGFAILAPGIAIHPNADRAALRALLERLRLTESVMVLKARDLNGVSALSSRALVGQCWNLEELGRLYQAFLTRFRPALAWLGGKIEPQASFAAQTLLIHAFRRTVLHDPRFPAELLPPGWPGHEAYELCREIYLRTFEPASQFVAQHLAAPAKPRLAKELFARFGGLK